MDNLEPFFNHIINHQIAMRQVIDVQKQISLASDLISDTIGTSNSIFTYGDEELNFISNQLVEEGIAQPYKESNLDANDILIFYSKNGSLNDIDLPSNGKIITFSGNEYSEVLDISDIVIMVKNNEIHILSEFFHLVNNVILHAIKET